jgi:hypothetical protein
MPENQDNPPAGPGEVGAEKIIQTPEDVMSLPAIHVDSYWVITWPSRIRITFGEVFFGNTVRYRTAISMGLAEAERFVRFLSDMIEKEKERQKKQG